MNTFLSKNHLQRVVIIGTSSTGKTTFAQNLACILNSKHIEMDELFWDSNWTPKTHSEFTNLVSSHTDADKWVIDGNYRSVRDIVWKRATTIIWLNYSFPVVFWRVIRRTFSRIFLTKTLWHGNKESIGRTFSKDSIILWVMKTHKRKQNEYQALHVENPYPHLDWIEFKHPSAAKQWLQKLNSNIH